MTRTAFMLALVATLLSVTAGCTSQPAQPPAPPPPPFKATVPLIEFMHHVMMPAANEIWSRLGTIITTTTIEERYPKTEEDWALMENGAVALSESANVLMMPGYARDNDEWMKSAVLMRDMGEKMLKAVQSQNREAVEEAAGEIDAVCDVCHEKYPPAEPPAGEAPKPTEAPK